MNERLNWLGLANKFALAGDPQGMRACARELFDLNQKSADGPAVMAEAALYNNSLEEAENLARDALLLDPEHLRARMVLGGLAAQKFELKEELSLLQGVVDEIHAFLRKQEEDRKRLHGRLQITIQPETAAQHQRTRELEDAEERVLRYLLFRSLGWLADGRYLAGDPIAAAEALQEASGIAQDREIAAELYSKHLFLRNYRELAPSAGRELAEKYQSFVADVTPYSVQGKGGSPDKKLRIGYISPDFRQHAVANFMLPLFRDFDDENFSVYCYSIGRSDAVTERLRRHHVLWRDVHSRPPRSVARMVAEDQIDILVDLSGHSQGNALAVMAAHAASVQICALGYTATTGLRAMDYFLSDVTCLPEHEKTVAFTEKILRLKHCHLCYAPGLVREMPQAGIQAPFFRNGYVTYGCFNNFAKVSDDVLYCWRAIMEQVPEAHLVLKSKICSIPSGRAIVMERLSKISFPVERVELRPYSPDYLEQYRDIDIALDTMPYNGGLTTCEALYMGVPVVTLRGRSHGARFGASILKNGDLAELVAETPMEYIKKAVQLGKRVELIAGYHSGLREHLQKSALMDSKQYMRELEACYREAWKACSAVK